MGISSALGSQALVPAGFGFRNLIINGDFRINQRGFSSTTTTGTYGFDRWRIAASGGTVTYSAQTFSLGNAIAGYEPTNFARVVTASQSASSNLAILNQPIEGVRSSAGVQVVISFWARASSGTPKVAVELAQNFGTGGSPSSQLFHYVGQATLSTEWNRYVFTFFVPSIAGRTIGTNNDDFLGLNLWTSAGSDFNSRTGSLGIQNTTIDFWGVQLEGNNVVTPFEQRPISVELMMCKRYFHREITISIGPVVSLFGSTFAGPYFLPVPMRRLPDASTTGNTTIYTAGGGVGSASANPAVTKVNCVRFQFNGVSGYVYAEETTLTVSAEF